MMANPHFRLPAEIRRAYSADMANAMLAAGVAILRELETNLPSSPTFARITFLDCSALKLSIWIEPVNRN